MDDGKGLNRVGRWLVPLVSLLTVGWLAMDLSGMGLAFPDWARRAIAFPFELDYGEGPILHQTTKLMNGHSFYTDPTRAPYNIGNYPPLYHLAVSAVSHLHQPLLGAGRLVSAVSTGILAVIAAGLVAFASGMRKGGGGRVPVLTGYGVRILAGVVAAFLFLSTKPVFFWGAFMRVDMLAVCLSAGGVLAYLLTSRRGWWVAVPVALFVLAAYTRQSVVAGAVAVLITAVAFRRRTALIAAGAGVAVGLAAFLAINATTHGQFLFHLVTANNNIFHWETVRRVFTEVLGLHMVPFGLAVVGALASLALALTGVKGADREARVLLALYLATSFAVSLTVGKVGSSYNYLVEAMLAMSVCVGVLLADLFDGLITLTAEGGLRGRARMVALVALVALSVFTVSRLAGYSAGYDPRRAVWLPAADENAEASGMEILGRVLRADGPVLSEVMTFLPQAGKNVEFQPFELSQLSYQGIWDQAPLLNDIMSGRFALVMLQFDVQADASWHGERFTPEMVAAIREYYRPAGFIGGMWLYEPIK